MSGWHWKRLDYLIHRWIGIVLGLLVLVWFISGIVMIYYPWPMPTASEEFSRMRSFTLPPDLIGFDSATGAARASHMERQDPVSLERPEYVGGRLFEWNGRLVYSLWRQHRYLDQPTTLVDARTGRVLSPITPRDAIGVARTVVGPLPDVTGIEQETSGDHYLMSTEYQVGFPAYVVHFDDASSTAVYVSREAGYVVGVVTDLTRWTTWLGTVPHWLYFKWLYSRHLSWWLWVSYVLPGIAVIAGLTGVVLGVEQLFPRRRRGEWRVSAYRGISKWHHIAGIVFGLLVITWSLSGLLEVLGPDGFPTDRQVVYARGPNTYAARISEVEALSRLDSSQRRGLLPIAIDRTRLEGEPGYVIHLEGQRSFWVDAVTGVPRGELDSSRARQIAAGAVHETAAITSVERLTHYDTYYYARPHREMPLPAWRVSFADPTSSAIYLDAVSGKPVGYVDTETRWYRWLRDGLHSFDFPGINDKRPLWDLVLLPLMLGGTIAAFTGVWLLVRRLRRMAR